MYIQQFLKSLISIFLVLISIYLVIRYFYDEPRIDSFIILVVAGVMLPDAVLTHLKVDPRATHGVFIAVSIAFSFIFIAALLNEPAFSYATAMQLGFTGAVLMGFMAPQAARQRWSKSGS